MSLIDEKLSEQFSRWENRGRGWKLWDTPVSPEPAFRPFIGHFLPEEFGRDDGRKPTLLSSLIRRLNGTLAPAGPREKAAPEEDEAFPDILVREELIELQAYLPSGLKFDCGAYGSFFTSLSVCVEPVTFEFVATHERIVAQLVVHSKDESLVLSQLAAFFPDVSFVSIRGFLEESWSTDEHAQSAVVEFGLGKEFMIPLDTGRIDPFVGLVGALSDLGKDEIALFQVIFAPVVAPWHESILRSVTHPDGRAYFVNSPELLPAAKEKTRSPLYAGVVRVAVQTSKHARTWEVACNVAGALGIYGSVTGNELIPLRNDEYPERDHSIDVVKRQTRRSGMILNAVELAGFVHLPSADVRVAKLRQRLRMTRTAPDIVTNKGGIELGTNVHLGLKRAVTLSNEQRARHIHIIGASGTGKSTLLFNLIRQDIERGDGISVIDPHGDLIDRVLGIIPESRIDDVVLLDPSDEEHIVGFNILSAHSDWEKNLLASDLVSVFRRNSTSWGDQLNSVLHNALLAFLKSERGGTLLDLRRFLLEPAFRNEILRTVKDSNVTYYWQKAFPQLTGNKSVGSVITRLDTFLSPEAIRYMVAQRANRLDFGDIMNGGKIFLAKLSRGAIGPDNSHLLGSLIVAKLQSEAAARQRQSESERRFHWAYLDEFHDFLTPSLAESLSGIRKYRLGLVLGHQEMRQVERDADVASALLSNAYTRVVFRVGDKDARTLENGFSSFDAKDLQNLGTGEAVCRVERSDFDFNLSVATPERVEESGAVTIRARVIAASRKKYSASRAEIEAMLSPAVNVGVGQDQARAPVAKADISKPVVEKKPAAQHVEEDTLLRAGEPVALPDLGRGGAQHKAIQDRIKQGAEKLGFRVVIEKEILGGEGRVDVHLTRDEISIACEVTIMTTIDHEVGNVTKCLKAGFTRIALISTSDEKLKKLAAAVANSLGEEKARYVSYHLPDAFLASLGKIETPAAAPEMPATTRGGRVVKRKFTAVSTEEAKAREEAAHRLMAEMMKKRIRPE